MDPNDAVKKIIDAHGGEKFWNGLMAPTRRRVRPILFGAHPLPGPILVALDIHHILPVSR